MRIAARQGQLAPQEHRRSRSPSEECFGTAVRFAAVRFAASRAASARAAGIPLRQRGVKPATQRHRQRNLRSDVAEDFIACQEIDIAEEEQYYRERLARDAAIAGTREAREFMGLPAKPLASRSQLHGRARVPRTGEGEAPASGVMDRSLMCANTSCHMKVNSDPAFGGYCCRKCHWRFTSGSGCKRKHGAACEQLPARPGALRALNASPDDE